MLPESEREEARKLFRWNLGTYGCETYEVSLIHHEEENEFFGADMIIKSGYNSICEILAKDLDIQLNSEVALINYEGD